MTGSILRKWKAKGWQKEVGLVEIMTIICLHEGHLLSCEIFKLNWTSDDLHVCGLQMFLQKVEEQFLRVAYLVKATLHNRQLLYHWWQLAVFSQGYLISSSWVSNYFPLFSSVKIQNLITQD